MSDGETGSSNVIAGDSTWQNLIDTLFHEAGTEEPKPAFSYQPYFKQVLGLFTEELQFTALDRKKLEIITTKVIDRSKQAYAAKLGEQLLVFRGRGGTGKTIRLVQMAY